MSFEFFEIHDRPAIYERTNSGERCIAWNREAGYFEDDPDALVMILSGSSDIRRIDKSFARLLVARMLARREDIDDDARAMLDELVAMENAAMRNRVPLTTEETRRRSEIASTVIEARLAANDAPGTEWERLLVD